MLTGIKLKAFKCFRSSIFPLQPMTVLTGYNSSGKSSVLQSLLLLHQTMRENEWGTVGLNNGKFIQLGSVGEIVNYHHRHSFEISLQGKNVETCWKFTNKERRDYIFPLESFSWKGEKEHHASPKKEPFHYLFPDSILKKNSQAEAMRKILYELSFISAERFGPRETYITSTEEQCPNVGAKGELTPWFLHHYQDKKVSKGLLHPNETSPQLYRQLNAWLHHFFPGAAVKTENLAGVSLISLRIRTRLDGEFYLPQNVGYGLTQILPIFVQCLGSPKNSLILIENPETHLHPAGQAEIGRFLGLVAASGVQVIIETHSDHVLNGVRKVVKEKKLKPSKTSLLFFNNADLELDFPKITNVLVDSKGKLENWPEGFFDQMDKDLEFLTDWND